MDDLRQTDSIQKGVIYARTDQLINEENRHTDRQTDRQADYDYAENHIK